MINLSEREIQALLAFEVQGDFSDILHAKLAVPRRPKMILSEWERSKRYLILCYRKGCFERTFYYHLCDPSSPPQYVLGKITFERDLNRARNSWSGADLPYTPYYGTVDASLLYVVTLYEAYRYSGMTALLDHYLPVAERCLKWAEEYGDADGDGFTEYAPKSPKGYRNQGWKNAGDAVLYPGGRLVDPPIAICEVQGYYYDALTKMAALYDLTGRPPDQEITEE